MRHLIFAAIAGSMLMVTGLSSSADARWYSYRRPHYGYRYNTYRYPRYYGYYNYGYRPGWNYGYRPYSYGYGYPGYYGYYSRPGFSIWW